MPKKKDPNSIIMTGYYRVSTKAESQKTSFENQPAYFRTLLEDPKYAHYIRSEKFYCDYGTSGTKLNRPGFVEMLLDAGLDVTIEDRADIPHPKYPDKTIKQRIYHTSVNPNKKPKFNEIWVKSTSRFARNINSYHILETLRLAKVYVYFIDIDLSTRDEDNMAAIRKKLDEDMAYSEQLSRNMRIAQKQYERENRVRGNLYGYIYHRRTKTKLPFYTLHPVESEVIKKIFTYCNQGLGMKAISNALATEGHFTRAGKPFTTSEINRILRNEKYMGLNMVSKFTTGGLFEKLSTPKILEDYKDRLQETDALPPIITPELWYTVQEVVANRRTLPSDPSSVGLPIPRHPFKDLLFCGNCGNHFVYDNNNGRGFFKCATKANQGITACNCNNLFVYKLDEFLDNLQNGGLYSLIETDYEMTIISLITLIEKYLCIYKNPKQISENNTEYQELQTQLQSQQSTRDGLLQMLTSSDFSQTTFQAFNDKINEIDQQIKTIESKIKELSTSPTEIAEKIQNLFSVIYQEFSIFESRKEKYSREEILNILSQIKIYGKTVNNSGGRPPQTILVPIIKITEQAQGLINIGLYEFKYRFRDGLQDYEPSQEVINPIDDDSIPAYQREELYTKAPKGKKQWPIGVSKYLLNNSAFYTPEGQIGYIHALGIKEISILQQLKDYVVKLQADFENTKKLYPNT